MCIEGRIVEARLKAQAPYFSARDYIPCHKVKPLPEWAKQVSQGDREINPCTAKTYTDARNQYCQANTCSEEHAAALIRCIELMRTTDEIDDVGSIISGFPYFEYLFTQKVQSMKILH